MPFSILIYYSECINEAQGLGEVRFFTILGLKVKVVQSCPALCDPVERSPPGPLSMEFPRQEYWSGLPFPFPILGLASSNQFLFFSVTSSFGPEMQTKAGGESERVSHSVVSNSS